MATSEELGVFPSDLRPPLAEVIADFDSELAKGHTREAAELAYAIAMRTQKEGRARQASRYARECLALVESLPSETITDVTSTRMKAGGVSLPDLLHGGVVRARLGHLIDA